MEGRMFSSPGNRLRLHKLEIATFLRTFSHDGIFDLQCSLLRVEAHARPFSLYLPHALQLGRPLHPLSK